MSRRSAAVPHARRSSGSQPFERGAGRLRSVEQETPSAAFARAVRAVGEVARRRGLSVPVFRSPPGLPGVDRTLRRAASGAVIVAVRLGDRPVASVHADVVDGVLAANGLGGADADRFRRAAWRALDGAPSTRPRVPSPVEEVADPPAPGDGDRLDDARVA